MNSKKWTTFAKKTINLLQCDVMCYIIIISDISFLLLLCMLIQKTRNIWCVPMCPKGSLSGWVNEHPDQEKSNLNCLVLYWQKSNFSFAYQYKSSRKLMRIKKFVSYCGTPPYCHPVTPVIWPWLVMMAT